MIKPLYHYDLAENPPAPFIAIRTTNPVTRQSEITAAKLDTGAARTVIPERLAERLGLSVAGFQVLRAFDGRRAEVLIYLADVELAGILFESVEVAAIPRSSILLGRDLLNQFDITLRGKAQTFDMAVA